jgi:hypothetical protein
MRFGKMKNRLQISDRTALVAMLALGLSALASIPFSAADNEGMDFEDEVTQASPATQPAETEVTDTTKFRLLLLRRG